MHIHGSRGSENCQSNSMHSMSVTQHQIMQSPVNEHKNAHKCAQIKHTTVKHVINKKINEIPLKFVSVSK